MHQAFQDCIVELEQLLRRTRAARGEFRKRTDRVVPESSVRFQVQSKALACYEVVELESGAVRGTLCNWKEAMNFAQQLEARPVLRLVQ
jgi:hypothetical protein